MPVAKSDKARKIRVASIVGARPQFIKSAMISRAIQFHNKQRGSIKLEEILIHTGQHYDDNLSRVFFRQMKIPCPSYNLGVGSGSHARMTAAMLIEIEKTLMKEKPDWVLVYGDTNTTLAGAFAAAKIPLPIAHIEAGLRSFNRHMPEEINRVLTDHLSCLLLCPTKTAVDNLKKEGIIRGVFNVGDVMYDAFQFFRDTALQNSDIMSRLDLKPADFCLATVHRQENTKDSGRLKEIFQALNQLARRSCPIIIPIHPRTKEVLMKHKIKLNSNVRLISPVSYFDMIALECNARIILTDSGGVQKEAFFAGIPCVILRDGTEWVETVDSGQNCLGGAELETIIEAFRSAEAERSKARSYPSKLFGHGRASHKIMQRMIESAPFDVKSWRPVSGRQRRRHQDIPGDRETRQSAGQGLNKRK
jgi:UDP-GlcNAc3NAcA epimerase